MLAPKRDDRLLSSRQFRAVYSSGQKFNTPYFSAFILPSEDARQRLGLTTTRKIGGAVLRNRCRRRLREIFRLRDRSVLNVGYDLVLNVKPTVATASYCDIEMSLSNTLFRFRQVLDNNKKRKECGNEDTCNLSATNL
jgi:ribonuclease P protein component